MCGLDHCCFPARTTDSDGIVIERDQEEDGAEDNHNDGGNLQFGFVASVAGGENVMVTIHIDSGQAHSEGQ